MPYFENDGCKIHYNDCGKGPVIIFCHGASFDLEQWESQVNYFEQNYRCITWDLRGHGKSELPGGDLMEDDYIQDLCALYHHLDIKEAALCGLSFGGILSTRFAALYPDKVSSLILIGTIYSFCSSLVERIFIPIGRLVSRLMDFNRFCEYSGKTYGVINQSTGEYAVRAMRQIGKKKWNRLWGVISRMNNKHLLPMIETRTLILHGDRDSATSSQQEYLRSNIKESKFVTVPDAHHGTNLDNPRFVNRQISSFLKG